MGNMGTDTRVRPDLLSKPEFLIFPTILVRRVCYGEFLVMNNGVKLTTAESLVENVLHLISLPEIYLRLQQVTDNPTHTRQQVADIVTYDSGLSARVLRIANSCYYSFPREIETVDSAVGLIGELELQNLVLIASVVGSMNSLGHRGVDIDAFWLHSLRCAITARLIGAKLGGTNPELLFVAGMLHDLGILVIYQDDVTLAAAVSRQIDEQHQLRDQAERELLGFDHAEVGALLVEAWGLPAELGELTRCHHQYQLARDDNSATMMLALANLLADDSATWQEGEDVRIDALLKSLELGPEDIEEIIETSDRQCEEVKNIIL